MKHCYGSPLPHQPHTHPTFIPPSHPHPQYNWKYDVVVSGDESGMLEYWGGPAQSYVFPKNVKFEHKIDTDLYEFVKVSQLD